MEVNGAISQDFMLQIKNKVPFLPDKKERTAPSCFIYLVALRIGLNIFITITFSLVRTQCNSDRVHCPYTIQQRKKVTSTRNHNCTIQGAQQTEHMVRCGDGKYIWVELAS